MSFSDLTDPLIQLYAETGDHLTALTARFKWRTSSHEQVTIARSEPQLGDTRSRLRAAAVAAVAHSVDVPRRLPAALAGHRVLAGVAQGRVPAVGASRGLAIVGRVHCHDDEV